jgi:hypothetical protein
MAIGNFAVSDDDGWRCMGLSVVFPCSALVLPLITPLPHWQITERHPANARAFHRRDLQAHGFTHISNLPWPLAFEGKPASL